GRLAEGKKFNPTKHQAQLAHDLENLPQFLCRQDDIVLVNPKPSVEFLSRLKQAGFPLPEFVAANSVRDLQKRKLGSLRPWAWGPDSFELLKPVFASVTGEKRANDKRFNEGIAQLYSKTWSAIFLRRIISGSSRGNEAQTLITQHATRITGSKSQSLLTSAAAQDWLCTENEIGVPVNPLDEARAAIAKIRARGHHKIVVKASFGVAGSNALRLFEPELLPAQLRWLENAFAHKRELVVEPWLERELDFSIQLEMTAHGLKLCGYTGLLNDARGQFQANFAEPHHHKRIPAKIISRFREPANISNRLLEFYGGIFAALEAELRRVDFAGPIGIDAFVYRNAGGAVKLKPVVEINPRYTMGRVLVELMRQTCQNCFGAFRLVNTAQLRAAGFEIFPGYAQWLEKTFPLQLEGEPVSRIREGALCLNDPAQAQAVLAVFQVSRTPDALTLPASRPAGCLP